MVFLFIMDIGFSSLLPRIVDSLVSLLESGGDREPDIIEQVYSIILENVLMSLSCSFLLW